MMQTLSLAAAGGAGEFGDSPLASVIPFFSLLLTAVVLAHHLERTRRARRKPSPEEVRVDADLLPRQEVDLLDRSEPTAILLVGGRTDLGTHVLKRFAGRCPGECKQVLFLAVGVVDASVADPSLPSWEMFERSVEAKRLRKHTRLALDPYVEAAHGLGLKADCRVSISTDPAQEIGRLLQGVVRNYSRATVLVGKLVFDPDRWYHRILHSKSADAIRESLERRGIPVTVVPVVLCDETVSTVHRP